MVTYNQFDAATANARQLTTVYRVECHAMVVASTSATTILTLMAFAKIASQSLDWMKKARKTMGASKSRAMRVALEFVQAELETRCNNGNHWGNDRTMLEIVNYALGRRETNPDPLSDRGIHKVIRLCES